MAIRSDAIRKAARGEECTLQVAGVCNHDTATTVFAHYPDESHGMALKADDISGGFACSACHDVIDDRVVLVWWEPGEKEWYMRRSMVRTWRRLLETGVVSIKGATW